MMQKYMQCKQRQLLPPHEKRKSPQSGNRNKANEEGVETCSSLVRTENAQNFTATLIRARGIGRSNPSF